MAGYNNLMHTFNSSLEYQFSWTIDNFPETPKVFQGPPFCPFLKSPEEKFCFEIKFVRETMGYCKFYSILYVYLKRLSGRISELNVRFDLSFRSTEDDILIDFNGFSEVDESCLLTQISFDGKAKHSLKNSFRLMFHRNSFTMLENKLVMKGKLIFCGGFINSINYSSLVQQSSEDREDLSKDLKAMYRSGLESDITIHIGDRTVFANKGILCCRSPVFRKMFDQNMKERLLNTINIEDIEFQVFDCFIMYLYTGELEDKTWDTVLSLYSVADKYEVKSLHSSCSRILASGLSVKYVCSVLLISVLHSDEELKKAAISFISLHFNRVAKRSQWAEIVSTKPQLASEVLSSLTALKLK